MQSESLFHSRIPRAIIAALGLRHILRISWRSYDAMIPLFDLEPRSVVSYFLALGFDLTALWIAFRPGGRAPYLSLLILGIVQWIDIYSGTTAALLLSVELGNWNSARRIYSEGAGDCFHCRRVRPRNLQFVFVPNCESPCGYLYADTCSGAPAGFFRRFLFFTVCVDRRSQV